MATWPALIAVDSVDFATPKSRANWVKFATSLASSAGGLPDRFFAKAIPEKIS